MSKLLLVVLLIVLGVSSLNASPVRSDIPQPPDVQCSSIKYIMPTIAPKTIVTPTNSAGVADLVKPQQMPEIDKKILAEQIAIINRKLKKDGQYPSGVKLQVPVYQVKNNCGLSQANLRNWNYAIYAGFKWGVSPAMLVAVRNHENPSAGRDFFALGVKHARGHIWKQYEQGAWVIKELIARRQGWNPWCPSSSNMLSCGRSYAEGSRSWGPAVWSLYLRATGRA